MLRPTWFEPLLDRRTDDRPRLSLASRRRAPRALGLRRQLGHALIALGRVVAAEARPARRPQGRRAC